MLGPVLAVAILLLLVLRSGQRPSLFAMRPTPHGIVTSRRLGFLGLTAAFVVFWLVVLWPTIALWLANG
jgi:hypothetical protein